MNARKVISLVIVLILSGCAPYEGANYGKKVRCFKGVKLSSVNGGHRFKGVPLPLDDEKEYTLTTAQLVNKLNSDGLLTAAEDDSFYGQISELTDRPKTVFVRGYYRKDGTYVRSHYRSPPSTSSPEKITTFSDRGVAENGSYYGEISPLTGRPKTIPVKGYYRKDGTYVRGHYRSKPR